MASSLIENSRVKVYQSLDPNVDVGRKPLFIIQQGAQKVSDMVIAATSFSNNQLSVAIQPPSVSSIVDPNLLLQITFNCSFTGTCSPGSTMLGSNTGLFSLRKCPIGSVTTNIQLNLANAQFNQTTSNFIDALLQYGTDDIDSRQITSPYVYPDQSQTYEQLAITTSSLRNPLQPYASSTPDYETRGSFNALFTNFVDTGAAASFQVTITEPLWISPLLFSPRRKDFQPLTGLNQLLLNMQFSDLSRIFSIALPGTTTISTKSVTIASSPNVFVRFYTPSIVQKIPPVISYGYNNIQAFSTYLGSKTAGLSFQAVTNNIQMSTVPKRVYIFCQPSANTVTWNTPANYAYLTNLSVQFNNQVGILSAASPEQLYQISCKNGLTNVSFPMYKSGCGSVFCADTVLDFALDPLSAAGQIGNNIQMQVTGQFTNISPNAVDFTMWVVVIQEAVMTIDRGAVFQQSSFLTQEDILKANEMPSFPMHEIQGGNFFGSIKSALSGIHDFVKSNKLVSKGAKLLATALPQTSSIALPISEAAERLGYGGVSGGQVLGGRRGGKMLSKSALSKKMMQGDY